MDIELHIGEIEVTKGPHNIIASGVGSCLVITLYDSKLQIGAFAHTMLPSSSKYNSEHEIPLYQNSAIECGNNQKDNCVNEQISEKIEDTRYVDVAINKMVQRMKKLGANQENMEAKLIGGANMFPSFKSDISRENIASAKKKLMEEGIRIAGECVGGSQGRSVEFSPTSGVVTVKIKF